MKTEDNMPKIIDPDIKRTILEDYEHGTPVKEICAKYKIRYEYLRVLARRYDIPARPKHYSQEKREAVIADYIAGLPAKVIARKHNVHPASARKIARAAGVARRPHRGGKTGYGAEKHQAILTDYLYGMTLKDLVEKYNISRTLPRKIAARYGHPPRPNYNRRRKLLEEVEKGEYSISHYEHNNPRGAMIFD